MTSRACIVAWRIILYLLIHTTIGQYESTLIKLQNAETQIDDLKAQLDATLELEDLLMQLTERNQTLVEVRGVNVACAIVLT